MEPVLVVRENPTYSLPTPSVRRLPEGLQGTQPHDHRKREWVWAHGHRCWESHAPEIHAGSWRACGMPCALDPTWARGSPAGQAHTGAGGNTQERMTVRGVLSWVGHSLEKHQPTSKHGVWWGQERVRLRPENTLLFHRSHAHWARCVL